MRIEDDHGGILFGKHILLPHQTIVSHLNNSSRKLEDEPCPLKALIAAQLLKHILQIFKGVALKLC